MPTSDPRQTDVRAALQVTVASRGSEQNRISAMAPDAYPDAQQGKAPPLPGKAAGKPSSRRKAYRLGDFELRKELGEGGMGKVYLAQQISLDRPCAVKVMSTELSKRPDFVKRFIREARAMARLDHPNVVRCFAVGEERGKHYVAMELIDGKSMQDWLDELEQLSLEDAVLVTLICADALQFAHEKNMIHRDIKPDNLLVTKAGFVKVADLGLAKATDEDMSMTQSGTGLGTPHYMPPEQARNAKHVDSRCDIYALGCTLYHFLTGKLPFSGETVVDLITAKEKGQFQPASRINSKVPDRLNLIIDKMMAKDPKHRYGSCAEVITDLEGLNLAGDSLSFVAGAGEAIIARRSNTRATKQFGSVNATTPMMSPGPSRSGRPGGTAGRRLAERASQKRSGGSHLAAGTSADWYVRHKDARGKIKVSKMSTQQVLQGMRADTFDLKTRIARDPQNAFVPLAQVPVFEDEANKMVTRVRSDRRDRGLSDAYRKIEKQYNRQKWWRQLGRLRDGTLGFFGLIFWLLLVAGAGALVIYGMMQGWEHLGHWIEGLN